MLFATFIVICLYYDMWNRVLVFLITGFYLTF